MSCLCIDLQHHKLISLMMLFIYNKYTCLLVDKFGSFLCDLLECTSSLQICDMGKNITMTGLNKEVS